MCLDIKKTIYLEKGRADLQYEMEGVHRNRKALTRNCKIECLDKASEKYKNLMREDDIKETFHEVQARSC
jgi:hypothetical protein